MESFASDVSWIIIHQKDREKREQVKKYISVTLNSKKQVRGDASSCFLKSSVFFHLTYPS